MREMRGIWSGGGGGGVKFEGKAWVEVRAGGKRGHVWVIVKRVADVTIWIAISLCLGSQSRSLHSHVVFAPPFIPSLLHTQSSLTVRSIHWWFLHLSHTQGPTTNTNHASTRFHYSSYSLFKIYWYKLNFIF